MTLYFSTKKIPQLQHLTLPQRLEALQIAERKLTGPEKLLLNILKLLVVIPVFVLIIQISTNWMAIFWALLVTLLYPLIIKPVHHGLCVKYIPNTHRQGD
ncbi:DUF6170 family protein [Paraglaciecola aquimarina]|uniref:DUF6170 family protein n=1 Tax=Paraglaciecola aquimarina TaxID=1235557 RepID=A0ABU3T1K8_9ALTE|nr:DUF6170 family protein [Paraglaciecola aquimarina]MDU0356128.1 DUF6170 family protein [Paraglaciecola aquimarina]